jgi:hypothetical protein
MAEWFKAAVLKKPELPHFNESQREASFFVYHFGKLYPEGPLKMFSTILAQPSPEQPSPAWI